MNFDVCIGFEFDGPQYAESVESYKEKKSKAYRIQRRDCNRNLQGMYLLYSCIISG